MNLAYSQNGFIVHSRLERDNTGKSESGNRQPFRRKKNVQKSDFEFSKAQQTEFSCHGNSEHFLHQDPLKYHYVPGNK